MKLDYKLKEKAYDDYKNYKYKETNSFFKEEDRYFDSEDRYFREK